MNPTVTIRKLLTIIFIDQAYLTSTFPLLTLIFFDSHSRLFATDASMQVRSLWFGLCVALPNFINVFFAPLLSALSDVIGRKKILQIEILSAFIFTITAALGIYYGQLILIFLAFVLKGAFARSNPTAMAIIGDCAPAKEKILYMGYLQFAISVGASIGPFLGGYFATGSYFDTFNFSVPFFLAAIIALFNLMLCSLIMPETYHAETEFPWQNFNLKAFKRVFFEPKVMRVSLILFLIQIGWSTFYQITPPVLKTVFGYEAHSLGLFIGMIAVWLAIATGIGITVLHRYTHPLFMLKLAISSVLFGLLLNILACGNYLPGHSFFSWVAAAFVAMGDVVAYSCLTGLYSTLVPTHSQGKVMGMSFIIVGLAWSSTGFIGGLLLGINPLLPLLLAPISILIAAYLVFNGLGRQVTDANN